MVPTPSLAMLRAMRMVSYVFLLECMGLCLERREKFWVELANIRGL